MINTKYFEKDKLPIIIFLLLILLITLFPPFSWGDERLLTEKERNRYGYGKRAYEIFPIKQYDFIFNNAKKEITSDNAWDWIDGKSVKAKFLLSRHLIISELIINYLLATICLRYVIYYGNPILTEVENSFDEVPTNYDIYQNFPNSFNPSTTKIFTSSNRKSYTKHL